MASFLEEQFMAIAAAQWAKSEGRRSWLLEYLPAMYAHDDFMNRYLQIFEDTLRPLQQMSDNLYYYFNPLTAPREVMEWLATWVSLTLDESWSLKQRRQLIQSASELYSWRGTKRGLIEYLRLYTGVDADISEYEDGMVLGPQSRLGINTKIAGREGFSFTVTMLLRGLSEEELTYKEAAIRRIIETEKPAHTAYRLRLITDEKDYIEKITPKARLVGEPLMAMEQIKTNGDEPTVIGLNIRKLPADHDAQVSASKEPLDPTTPEKESSQENSGE